METSLFELAAKDGLWAALYVFLFIYVLFDSRAREKKLQQTIAENQRIIAETVQKLGIVEDIHEDIGEVNEGVKEVHKDVKDIKAEVFRR